MVKDKIILIDKPAGWTSFDVVAKIRGKIRAEYTAKGEKPTKRQLRVGHAGTLDPFATGLLIILISDACKKAGEFLKLDKTYEFTAKLGEVSSTGDPEGDISTYMRSDFSTENGKSYNTYATLMGNQQLSVNDIKTVLQQFIGEISQTPPQYSAIKINGKRAYKLAREGKQVDIPTRKVQINRLELVEYNYPYLKCVCDVSSGTYIRSLVEDIGKVFKTGAYCQELRRIRIGNYKIEDATTVALLTIR